MTLTRAKQVVSELKNIPLCDLTAVEMRELMIAQCVILCELGLDAFAKIVRGEL